MALRIRNTIPALIAALAAGGGCQSNKWRPTMDAVRPAENVEVDLASYFPSADDYAQTFLRARDGTSPDSGDRIPRELDARGYRQGLLVSSGAGDLQRCIAPEGQSEPEQYLDWPGEARDNNAGFILEFDPPLPYLPVELRPDRPVFHQGKVRAFNRWGHPARSGAVTRRIWLEGREDVTASGADYRDCVRVLAETRIRLRWGPKVDVTEYIWLAPRVGEIRRIARIAGLALPFVFEDTSTYELVPERSEHPMLVAYRPSPTRAWSRVAVYLDPLFPRPNVAGVIVEYAEDAAPVDRPPPTSQPG